MNRGLRDIAERVLLGTGVASVGRRRLRGRTLVLAYHNVLPDGAVPAGDLSLHLPRREFARQLDVLAHTHRVVPIEAVSQASRRAESPRVVITFDDAYAGALSIGLDELVKRRMPATIFVPPGLLGSVPWWDVLAERFGGVIPDRARADALHASGGRADTILGAERTREPVSRALASVAGIATESELATAAARPGITIGSHSWSHPNLSALQSAALEEELRRPQEWLRSRFRTVVPWLSYPYGLFNDAVKQAAAHAGYAGALRIDGGWARASESPSYALARLNVPAGLSLNGFQLRLSGL